MGVRTPIPIILLLNNIICAAGAFLCPCNVSLLSISAGHDCPDQQIPKISVPRIVILSLVLGQKEPTNDLLERVFVSPGSILVLFCCGSCSRCIAACWCLRSSILFFSGKFAMPAHQVEEVSSNWSLEVHLSAFLC